MQNDVMFGILLTILNKRKVSRVYLAEKYELSERTVMRYLDALSAGGVPIISLRGKNGGYTIADDYKIDKNYFTADELIRLTNCLKATMQSFNDRINQNILDKILNLKMNKSEDKYFLKTDTLIIDAGTWNNPQKFRNKISVINKAINTSLSIYMSYTDKKEFSSTRMIDPYSLVLKEGIWYIYGWCHFRKDFRLFKLSRINTLTLTETPFERKPSDVYEKLSERFDDSEIIDIEFEFSSTIISDIEEWLGSEAVSERGTQYIAKASIFGGNQLINKILSFGSSIKILSPTTLREEVLIECGRILKIYR